MICNMKVHVAGEFTGERCVLAARHRGNHRPALSFDPATGLPINPATGNRYGAVEPHPFVLTPNTAQRGHVCHVCNGARDYVAHTPFEEALS